MPDISTHPYPDPAQPTLDEIQAMLDRNEEMLKVIADSNVNIRKYLDNIRLEQENQS